MQEGQAVGEVRSDDRRMRLVMAMMKSHSTTDQNMSYCDIQMCLNAPLKIIYLTLHHFVLFPHLILKIQKCFQAILVETSIS